MDEPPNKQFRLGDDVVQVCVANSFEACHSVGFQADPQLNPPEALSVGPSALGGEVRA